MRDTRYTSYIMWNNDMQPESNAPNAYGSHPFMMSLTQEGKAHGIAFHNSHAMEVSLQPTPAATFRALGGDFDIRYKHKTIFLVIIFMGALIKVFCQW